jgi:hypothetical protein
MHILCTKNVSSTYEEAADGVEGHEGHDSDNQTLVNRNTRDTQQHGADSHLDEVDAEQIEGLRNVIQLDAHRNILWRNIAHVPSSAITNRGDDESFFHDDQEGGGDHEHILSKVSRCLGVELQTRPMHTYIETKVPDHKQADVKAEEGRENAEKDDGQRSAYDARSVILGGV